MKNHNNNPYKPINHNHIHSSNDRELWTSSKHFNRLPSHIQKKISDIEDADSQLESVGYTIDHLRREIGNIDTNGHFEDVLSHLKATESDLKTIKEKIHRVRLGVGPTIESWMTEKEWLLFFCGSKAADLYEDTENKNRFWEQFPENICGEVS